MSVVTHLRSPRRPALALGAHPAGGPVACEPSFPGTQEQDPRLGKRTTCFLGSIRFQGEATGFTLKITKHANSFNMQMFFISVGQII